MARGHRTTVAAIVAGLALAGCGGEAASITTDEDARQAIVDTFRDSWSADVRVDMELTDDHIEAVLDAVQAAEGATQTDVAFGREYLSLLREQAATSSAVFARGEDGSWRMTSIVDDAPVLDLRLDVSSLLAADTLTPEVTALVQVDIPAFLAQMRESMAMMADVDPTMPDPSLMFPGVEVIRQQAATFVPPGGVRDVVLAIIDGSPGGATGMLDLAGLGVTEADLAELRTGWRDEFLAGWREEAPVDPDELAAMFAEAISIHGFVTAGGLTTAQVDLHPRLVVTRLGELSEAAGETDDWRADFEGETGMAVADLPETMPGVARMAFDAAGRLRHLVVPVLDVARQVVDLVDDVPPEVHDVLAELDDARYDLVMTISDVGQVDTVVDVDATTVGWDELVRTLEALDGMSRGS